MRTTTTGFIPFSQSLYAIGPVISKASASVWWSICVGAAGVALQIGGYQNHAIAFVIWLTCAATGFLAVVRSQWFAKLARQYGTEWKVLTSLALIGAVAGASAIVLAWILAGRTETGATT